MKGVIESEGSKKREDDSVAGWGERSVCHFRGEFSCLGDSTQVLQGREGSGLSGCGLQGFSKLPLSLLLKSSEHILEDTHLQASGND